jgi:HK97 gp10 family phage protein
MAKASFKMPEDFLLKVSRLGAKTDEIMPRVLESGGDVALQYVQNNLRQVTSGQSTGELANSLGVTPAKQDKDGNFNVKIGFREPRSDGESNAKIANIIEHGKHNQPPHPFLKPAKSQSKQSTISAMIEKLNEEIENL